MEHSVSRVLLRPRFPELADLGRPGLAAASRQSPLQVDISHFKALPRLSLRAVSELERLACRYI